MQVLRAVPVSVGFEAPGWHMRYVNGWVALKEFKLSYYFEETPLLLRIRLMVT